MCFRVAKKKTVRVVAMRVLLPAASFLGFVLAFAAGDPLASRSVLRLARFRTRDTARQAYSMVSSVRFLASALGACYSGGRRDDECRDFLSPSSSSLPSATPGGSISEDATLSAS